MNAADSMVLEEKNMGRIITVAIPGKAWRSQGFGNDPHYTFDEDSKDIEAIVKLAEVKKLGKGTRVVIHGEESGMEHLAKWLHDDGTVWLSQCADDPSAQAEARACIEAARRIRAEINRK